MISAVEYNSLALDRAPIFSLSLNPFDRKKNWYQIVDSYERVLNCVGRIPYANVYSGTFRIFCLGIPQIFFGGRKHLKTISLEFQKQWPKVTLSQTTISSSEGPLQDTLNRIDNVVDNALKSLFFYLKCFWKAHKLETNELHLSMLCHGFANLSRGLIESLAPPIIPAALFFSYDILEKLRFGYEAFPEGPFIDDTLLPNASQS